MMATPQPEQPQEFVRIESKSGGYRMTLYPFTPGQITLDVTAEQMNEMIRKVANTVAEPVMVLDWDKYGSKWKWFAVDKNGDGSLYSETPVTGNLAWLNPKGSARYINDFSLNDIDWRETLTARPSQPPSGVTRA